MEQHRATTLSSHGTGGCAVVTDPDRLALEHGYRRSGRFCLAAVDALTASSDALCGCGAESAGRAPVAGERLWGSALEREGHAAGSAGGRWQGLPVVVASGIRCADITGIAAHGWCPVADESQRSAGAPVVTISLSGDQPGTGGWFTDRPAHRSGGVSDSSGAAVTRKRKWAHQTVSSLSACSSDSIASSNCSSSSSCCFFRRA